MNRDVASVVFAALVFGLACVGHATLHVAAINRVHALKLSWQVVRAIEMCHNLILIVCPAVALATAVLLPWNEVITWQRWPWPLQAYVATCLVSTAGLGVVVVGRHLRKLPTQVISERTKPLDIVRILGRRPIQTAWNDWKARLPGNQILAVEFTEKEWEIVRLPADLDGLKVLHISDFHLTGDLESAFFETALRAAAEAKPDVVAFTGDLLDNAKCLEWLGPVFGLLTAPLGCYFVLGNHDWYLGCVEETRSALTKLGWIDISGEVRTIACKGASLAIAGVELPWMGSLPQFDTANKPHELRVLLSHTPDYLPWARRRQVDIVLAGHNHGGQIRLPLIGPVYSPSLYGGRYASGTFFESPTLLHVSRGLSGAQLVRFNCAPELTLITLRASR